jgi:hypothetical protein
VLDLNHCLPITSIIGLKSKKERFVLRSEKAFKQITIKIFEYLTYNKLRARSKNGIEKVIGSF